MNRNAIRWAERNLPYTVSSRPTDQELVLMLVWLLVGVSMLISGTTQEWAPARFLDAIPSWLELLMGASVTVGTGSLFVAAVVPFGTATERWAYEQLGLILAGVGWAAYTVTAIVVAPWQVAPWLIGTGFTLAAVTKFLAVVRHARATEHKQQLAGGSGEDPSDAP